MAKAVFVREMPDSCDMCDFCEDSGISNYCEVPGIGQNVDDYILCRPGWCPLRELPEKMDGLMAAELVPDCENPVAFAQGWNALREKIIDN